MNESRPAEQPVRRVLVVDDDGAVANVIRRILGAFDVTYAQSAAGALGRIAAGGQFAVIVCDFRMPGMDGRQFHEEVSKLDSGLSRRIVYVTGSGESQEFSSFLQRTRRPWLAKPFDRRSLRALVEEVAAAWSDSSECSDSSGSWRR